LPRPPEYEGHRLTIVCAELTDGSCPAAEFLDGLDEGDRQKFDVLFERLGNSGHITNPEHFKKLEGTDGIFEFKRFQLRLYCCYGPEKGVVSLLYGIRKKQKKHRKADVVRAEQYKQQITPR
jgi:hypothetical protein